jgi:hypothetical protein
MDAVMANRRDRRIAVVASEERAQHRGPYGTRSRRVLAMGGEWTVRHPRLEDAAHFETLDAEGHLAERRDGRCGIPLDVDAPPEGIECNCPCCPANALRGASPMG